MTGRPGSGTAIGPAEARQAAPTDGALLVLQGISKSWGRGEGAQRVLDRVDLQVAPASRVAVSGRNGAGKTTLLRIASGLIAPDAGFVTLAGYDAELDRREFQRRVGLVSAGNGALYARLTVYHHLDMAARLALLPRAARRAATARMLGAFELGDLARRRVDRLSTGQRQRLRLALAFLHDPSVVLLDEPESSLDDEGLGVLADEVTRVCDRGGAVILCSPSGMHDRLEADVHYAIRDGALDAA